MKLLNIADDWLLDRVFQPFSDWFQKLTGKSCFFLAYASVALNAIASSVNDLFKGDEIAADRSWAHLSAFSMLTAGLFLYLVYVTESKWHTSKGGGECLYGNEARVGGLLFFLRQPVLLAWGTSFSFTFCMGIIKFTIEGCSGVIAATTFVTTLYFASCTPLPPQKSKIRKWLGNVRSFIARAREAVTAPGWQPAPAER